MMPKFNDINLKKWKESEIWTDSLWLISKRDKSGKHNNKFHGNFVPQIPHQLILRYTKKDDIVLDPFLGSGTTAYECEALNRNLIGVDIQEQLIKQAEYNLDDKKTFSELLIADSTSKKTFDQIKAVLKKRKKNKIQLAILHPPYLDIIKFSELTKDLSNTKSLEDFLNKFNLVLQNTIEILEKDKYLAIIIGDKYTNGQWIPLGFRCMNDAQKLGLTLKSIVVKNMDGSRAKRNKEGLWRCIIFRSAL